MDRCTSMCPKWPVTRKCCFCVPIRRGITIFGYINLVVSLLSVPVLVYQIVKTFTSQPEEEVPDPTLGLRMRTPAYTVILAFVGIDIIMSVVLLIGAHRKKPLLLKIYFYSGIVLELVNLCADLAFFNLNQQYVFDTLYLLSIGLNIYLLFLVFNTIHLLEESAAVRYVTYPGNEVIRDSCFQ